MAEVHYTQGDGEAMGRGKRRRGEGVVSPKGVDRDRVLSNVTNA